MSAIWHFSTLFVILSNFLCPSQTNKIEIEVKLRLHVVIIHYYCTTFCMKQIQIKKNNKKITQKPLFLSFVMPLTRFSNFTPPCNTLCSHHMDFCQQKSDTRAGGGVKVSGVAVAVCS